MSRMLLLILTCGFPLQKTFKSHFCYTSDVMSFVFSSSVPPKIPEVAAKSETKAPEAVVTEMAKKEEVKEKEEKVEVEEKTEEKETAEEKEDEEEKVVEMERPIEAAASAALLASVVLDDRQDEEAEAEERQEDVRVQPPSPEPPRAELTLPSLGPSYGKLP